MNLKEFREFLKREQFIVAESSMTEFEERPYRLGFGANILCLSGEAEFLVNMSEHTVRSGTSVFILPHSMVNIRRISKDFRMKFFLFSEELFRDATFRMDPELFRYIIGHPFLDPGSRSLPSIEHWMQMAEYTYNDRENIHRLTITRNRLQNIFLELHDKFRRGWDLDGFNPVSSRRSELFHRFMDLVRSNCCQQRDVTFYADKLCITSRYLATVCRSAAGRTAKEMIDHVLLQEIKMRLHSTDLSVQEIAYELHFPDQSYLGRFFKRHTGQSPSAYRATDAGQRRQISFVEPRKEP